MKQSRRVNVGLIILVAASFLLLTDGSSANAGIKIRSVPACEPSANELKYSELARSANGFSSDRSLIARVACGNNVSPSRIGVPITPAEDAELTRRTNVGERMVLVGQKTINSKSFVNSWMDPKTGEAVFAFIPGSTPDRTAIQHVLPAGTPIRLVSGAVPLDRQEEINAALVSNFAALRDSGLKIVGSDTDPNTGVVTVAIDPTNALGAEMRLATVLGSSGLEIVRVDTTTWSTPQDARTQPTGRQYGGAYISSPNNNSACTSSPSAKSNNGYYYTVTAGHCGHPGYAWRQGNSLNPNYPLGSGQGNTLYPPPASGTTDCECQGIGVLSSTKRTSGVLINSNALYLYTGSAGEGNYYTGRTICFSGGTEYETYGGIICGHIRGLNGSVTVTPNGVSVLVYNLIQADFNTTLAGDSGGPYGDGPTWFGVHFGLGSCGTQTCSVFSRSSRVVSSLAIYLQNLGY